MESKTVREWFELVADEKLRSELLSEMNEPDMAAATLSNAIGAGFNWTKSSQGFMYWSIIYDMAIACSIPLLAQRKPTPNKNRIKVPIKLNQSDNDDYSHLSKREYFAAMALQGLIGVEQLSNEDAAKQAVKAADLLIEELNKK